MGQVGRATVGAALALVLFPLPAAARSAEPGPPPTVAAPVVPDTERRAGFRTPTADEVRAAGLRPGTGPCAGMYEFASTPGSSPKPCTHGPDVYDAPATASASGGAKTLFTRASDIPCSSRGPYVRVLYIYGNSSKLDAANPNAQRPLIREAIGLADLIVKRSARTMSGIRHVRWAMNSKCKLSIRSARIDPTLDLAEMERRLRAKGKLSSNEKALIFVEGSGCWGLGQTTGDTRRSQKNSSNYGGLVARVQTGCLRWGNNIVTAGEVAAHEVFHTLGAVNNNAPNASGYYHCTDESDVMCYEDGPGVTMRKVCDKTVPELLDCRHNDYFALNPKDGSYLDKYWNTAKNRFLRSSNPSKSDRLDRPSLTIVSPVLGDLAAGRMLMEATASAPSNSSIKSVRFVANGALVKSDTSAPYAARLDTVFDGTKGFRNGQTITLTVKATDTYRRWTQKQMHLVVGNPTVRLTAPSQGALVSNTLAWAADASAAAGRTVQKVELLINGSVKGTDLEAPYGGSVSTSTFSTGAQLMVRARVTDSGGAVRWGPERYVSMGIPTVSLDVGGPSWGDVTGPIRLLADADPIWGTSVTQVQFRVDGIAIATDTNGSPYEASWTPPSTGTKSLVARMTDSTGRTVDSDPRQVTVATSVGGSVTLDAPLGGAEVSGSEVALAATPTAPTGYTKNYVEFIVDGSAIGWADGWDGWATTWDTTGHAPGTHLVSAVLHMYDESFVESVVHSPGSVVTIAGGATVTVTAPTSGTRRGLISLGASVTSWPGGGAPADVKFYANGDWVGQDWDPAGGWTAQWDSRESPDGDIEIRAVASGYFNDGYRVVSDPVVVTLANLRAVITDPDPGDVMGAPTTITVTGRTDSGSVIEWIEFYVDGSKIGRDGTAPYSKSWSGTSGSHTLIAKLIAADGREVDSVSVSVTVT